MEKRTRIYECLNKALRDEMTHDPSIIIMGEEVGRSGGNHKITQNLYDEFGKERVIDTPISEIGFTGIAVGASFLGVKPVVEFMTWNFALQSIDHIVNSCAKRRYMTGGAIGCSIVFRGPNGYNPGYAAEHTQDFTAWYGSVPGLIVLSPYTAADHYNLLRLALKSKNPVVFLENESMYNDLWPEVPAFDPNYGYKARIEKEGDDITLVGTSIAAKLCMEVAKTIENISCEVINLNSIRPLDLNTIIKSAKKTGRICIVDYNWPRFGLASEICASVNENLDCDVLKSKIVRITGKDVPTPYAKNLEEMSFPTAKDIITKIKEMM